MSIQWRLPTQTIPQEFQIRSMLAIVYNPSNMLCTVSKQRFRALVTDPLTKLQFETGASDHLRAH